MLGFFFFRPDWGSQTPQPYRGILLFYFMYIFSLLQAPHLFGISVYCMVWVYSNVEKGFVWFAGGGGGGMRENYNRPQIRGYWDAPKSKDDSRWETFRLLVCKFTKLFFNHLRWIQRWKSQGLFWLL